MGTPPRSRFLLPMLDRPAAVRATCAHHATILAAAGQLVAAVGRGDRHGWIRFVRGGCTAMARCAATVATRAADAARVDEATEPADDFSRGPAPLGPRRAGPRAPWWPHLCSAASRSRSDLLSKSGTRAGRAPAPPRLRGYRSMSTHCCRERVRRTTPLSLRTAAHSLVATGLSSPRAGFPRSSSSTAGASWCPGRGGGGCRATALRA